MTASTFIALSVAALATVSSFARADFAEYYVGIDTRATLPSGTYAGQANPNLNRLSLLYAHTYPDAPATNHYHNKSAYSYAGPAASPTVNAFPTGNFLPESGPAIPLTPGSGAFVGKLRTGLTPDNAWSQLEMRDTGSLSTAAAGSPEAVLFNSSLSAYSTPPTGAGFNLRVVSMTPGLTMLSGSGVLLADGAGDVISLGASGGTFSFTPVFAADTSAFGQGFSARLVLTDSNNAGRTPYGDSGEFVYNFAAVPEPTSLALAALGGCVLLRRKR